MLEGNTKLYHSTLVLDFDGTVARTFERSPNGVGVNEAYEAAIKEFFGKSALTHYLETGGLMNRSPREVVIALQEAGFQPTDNTSELTNVLVNFKISCLLGEVGQRLTDGEIWPRLTPGFGRFWETLRVKTLMYTGILSSGHRAFIERTFEVHGLELPDVLVTDDELRALPTPLSKPDPALLTEVDKAAGFTLRRSTTCFVGDDLEKDGKFAKNCGIDFFHLVPPGSTLLRERKNTFENWSDLGRLILRYQI